MNRYRLNQILEVLLFPVSDPEQGKEDILLKCYQAYHDFMQECEKVLSRRADRQDKNEKFREAQKDLRNYLVSRNHFRIKSEDDIQLLCEIFYPLTEIEQMMWHLKKDSRSSSGKHNPQENISFFYLQNLKRISLSLITYRNGTATIKQWVKEEDKDISVDIFGNPGVFNKIEIWNLLCRFTAPDLYIAIAAVEIGHGIEALYEQKSQLMLADKLLEKCLQKGVAENHLHFHVGYDYEIFWLHYMDLCFANEPQKNEKYTRLQMALFRCVAAIYLNETSTGQDFESWLQNSDSLKENEHGHIVEIIYTLYRGEYDAVPCAEDYKQAFQLYGKCKNEYSIIGCDYLLDKIYAEYTEYKTSSEFLLLYKCYAYIKNCRWDGFFARLFLQYLRLKNQYFHDMCEQNILQGLKYFQAKYSRAKNAMREWLLPTDEAMLEVFRSQGQIANLNKLEIRVAPWVNVDDFSKVGYSGARRIILPQLIDQLMEILGTYRRYILESVFGVKNTYRMLKMHEDKNVSIDEFIQNAHHEFALKQPHIPTLGIIYAFLKREELENLSGNYCWRSMLTSPNTDSVTRLYLRVFMANVAIALEELRGSIPKLSEYLVGIDAASDENAMEPWMFSSVYKTMRSHEYVKPVAQWQDDGIRLEKVQNIGFTYHVGEDFRHIASGLRHVDEVLENFSYKTGDRLGHSLVLGIDVDQWIDDNEVVPMPLMEYMENLLWIWGLNVHEGLELELQLEILEAKILDVARKIYPHTDTLTVKMLYSAYKMKFDVNHNHILTQLVSEKDKNNHTFCRYGGSVQQNIKTEDGKKPENSCYVVWSAEKLLSTNYCPVYEERGGRKELVSVRKKDAVLYKKLQEYLVQKVERRGIYVEANPTSNSIIGDFSNIQKHPVFFINQKFQDGKHRVMATVNSDDPAVFNTNVENELAYIYYAAEAKGYVRSELLEWIDQLRQYGVDASFIRKEKKPELLLVEVEEMLTALKNFKL